MDEGFTAPAADYGRLETEGPAEILRWAAAHLDRLAVATSFQSSGLVLLHLLRNIRPDLPVLFLDTGWHFPETLAFKERIAFDWDLKLVVLTGAHAGPDGQEQEHGPELYRRDPDLCCHINKVDPLQRALEEYDGWISGLRRDQSPLRSGTPIIEAQLLPSGRETLKIHPLANWSRAAVDAYVRAHSIPTHPLLERGYSSIGCAPCTQPAADAPPGERAGRWAGQAKTECGIHTFGIGATRETEADQ